MMKCVKYILLCLMVFLSTAEAVEKQTAPLVNNTISVKNVKTAVTLPAKTTAPTKTTVPTKARPPTKTTLPTKATSPTKTTPASTVMPTSTPDQSTVGVYRGNKSSKVFHAPGCRYYRCKKCKVIFKARSSAIKAGYKPCKICGS